MFDLGFTLGNAEDLYRNKILPQRMTQDWGWHDWPGDHERRSAIDANSSLIEKACNDGWTPYYFRWMLDLRKENGRKIFGNKYDAWEYISHSSKRFITLPWVSLHQTLNLEYNKSDWNDPLTAVVWDAICALPKIYPQATNVVWLSGGMSDTIAKVQNEMMKP